MRVARNDLALKSALQQAQAEAEAAFGNGERLPGEVHRAAAARRGAGPRRPARQRACTSGSATARMQRRHQKLIEESPAPHLAGRRAAGDVRGGRAADQDGRLHQRRHRASSSSTSTGNFYFIEVNARIQVEHPVTEMVTGIDLIKRQIRIAAGEPLPFKQEDIRHRGAAIECRINAEDPRRNFQPSPGQDQAADRRPAAPACGSTRTPTPATSCRRTTTR